MKDHHLIKAVHEFGRELAPRRFHGRALYLLVQPSGRLVFWLNETHATLHQPGNLAAAEVGRQKDHRLRQSTFRLSPRVSVALSSIPRSNCHRASLAFSISSKRRKLSFRSSRWLAASVSWVMSGCVSRCPRYPGGEPMSLAIS